MKFSIITAAFNSEHTIRDTINSVNSQTYENIEHIFIDGESNDSTLDIIRRLSKRNPNISSQKDSGIYDALNKGANKATGDIVGFLHSDDLFFNENVLDKVANIFKDPSINLCYGDLQYVDSQNTKRIIRHWKSGTFSNNKLYNGWMPPHPTVFLRRDFLKLDPFNQNFKISADYDFILNLLLNKKIKVAYLPQVLIKMRVGGISNRSIQMIIQKSREDLKIINFHNLKGVRTLAMKNLRKIPQFFFKKDI